MQLPVAGKRVVTLGLAWLGVAALDFGEFSRVANAATPPLPIINTNVILDVTNTVFAGGALGDGVSNSAAAINAAINAATTNLVGGVRGAVVRIPANGTLSTYLSGPI